MKSSNLKQKENVLEQCSKNNILNLTSLKIISNENTVSNSPFEIELNHLILFKLEMSFKKLI